MAGEVFALVMLAAAQSATPAAPPKADWKAFADCAAAYRSNAAIVDPARTESMKAMVSDTAQDFETAAIARYRETSKASAETAVKAVAGRVKSELPKFTAEPRTRVEHFIDACPQTEG